MTSAIKTCNDNKVYLAQFFRVISQENSKDIYDLATASPYYIGAVHENEPENGEKLVQILLDKGDRNIGLIGWEQGDATWLGRWEGYKAGVENGTQSIRMIRQNCLSRSTQVLLLRVVPRQQRL